MHKEAFKKLVQRVNKQLRENYGPSYEGGFFLYKVANERLVNIERKQRDNFNAELEEDKEIYLEACLTLQRELNSYLDRMIEGNNPLAFALNGNFETKKNGINLAKLSLNDFRDYLAEAQERYRHVRIIGAESRFMKESDDLYGRVYGFRLDIVGTLSGLRELMNQGKDDKTVRYHWDEFLGLLNETDGFLEKIALEGIH